MAMPTFPGVFIREVSSGVRTITGVSTSIALFVGRSMSGPLNDPQRIFGFTDYARVFSADTSFGEMTDQVRQFFLNGGQQAFVVRVANGAQTAEIELKDESAATAFKLTAVSPGAHGETLRASVDYNTADPERTFNLRLYRETVSDGGSVSESDSETHQNLSMDPDSPRYVETVLENSSSLARAESISTATDASVSVSKYRFGTETDVGDALVAAVPTGTVGKFRIQAAAGVIHDVDIVGDDVDAAPDKFAYLNGQLPPGYTASVPGDGYLRITGTDPNDTRVLPGLTFDIAGTLGLGLQNGGLEIGPRASARPVPNGIVSRVSSTAAGAERILALSNVDVDTLRIANMAPAGVGEFTVSGIAYAGDDDGTLGRPSSTDPETRQTLTNLRGSLSRIASAINAATTEWRAEVHGLRLALTPLFGTSQIGTAYTFTLDDTTTPPYDGYTGLDAGQIFENPPAAPTVRAAALAVPNPMQPADGFAPLPQDYTGALQVVEESVDLVNLIVLPKDRDEVPDTRTGILSIASAWAQKNRAFLLVDPPAGVDTVQEMEDGILDLRDGIVLDHSGVYFPRVEVIDATGARKTVDPGGSIAGLMARIDSSRGVWKAPAGIEASLRGTVDVETPMSDEQNGVLNPLAVNAIRDFPEGIISWGARTMDGFDNSGNTDYKYVPVRRFALFLEESLVRGLRFAVFEPNGPALWQQIRLAAGAFLNGLFRQGAFAGDKARDAYFVKVDQETTTPTDINLGIVNVVVGFSPLKPAEFVIITIQQQTAQVQV